MTGIRKKEAFTNPLLTAGFPVLLTLNFAKGQGISRHTTPHNESFYGIFWGACFLLVWGVGVVGIVFRLPPSDTRTHTHKLSPRGSMTSQQRSNTSHECADCRCKIFTSACGGCLGLVLSHLPWKTLQWISPQSLWEFDSHPATHAKCVSVY